MYFQNVISSVNIFVIFSLFLSFDLKNSINKLNFWKLKLIHTKIIRNKRADTALTNKYKEKNKNIIQTFKTKEYKNQRLAVTHCLEECL